MTHMDLLAAFMADWNERARRGEVSDLSLLEEAILEIFARWLDTRRKDDLCTDP